MDSFDKILDELVADARNAAPDLLVAARFGRDAALDVLNETVAKYGGTDHRGRITHAREVLAYIEAAIARAEEQQ